MKVKPGFHWRSQDVGHARAVGYLLRTAADRVWKREKLQSANLEGVGGMKSHLIDTLDSEFEVCPAVFQPCCGPVFLPYAPIPSFWKGNVSFCDCMLEVCNWPFDVTGRYSEEVALSLRRDFGLLNSRETGRA